MGCCKYCESEKEIQSLFQSTFNYNDPNVVEKMIGNGDGEVVSKSISELVGGKKKTKREDSTS